jgi:hypothetical protein
MAVMRSRTSRMALLARLFASMLGFSAVVWGAMTLPVFWAQAGLEGAARHIIDRDAFAPEALAPLIPAVESAERADFCRPEELRGAAIVRLRLAEEAVNKGVRAMTDRRLDSMRDTARRSLSCSPADPFLWMVLTWAEGVQEGFRPSQLQYLRLSYLLGPNEGWIAARRNGLALSMHEDLPSDMIETATIEFAQLLDSWFYWETIINFTGPGWRIHDKLLERIKVVSEPQREAFARALYAQGFDVAVPGVAAREPRPWH